VRVLVMSAVVVHGMAQHSTTQHNIVVAGRST
jgi:hypothetical protein